MKPILPLALVLCSAPAWAQQSLSVRVVDSMGAPIKGAQVHVQVWLAKAPAVVPKTTDASGNALFSIPLGSDKKPVGASIVAGAKGFAFNGTRAVKGKAEVRLERGAAWRGKVVDEAGKPLASVKVALHGAMPLMDFQNSIFWPKEGSPLTTLYSALSKADGTFVIPNVPSQKELFYEATLPDFSIEDSQSARAGVEERIQLARAGTLRGRALDLAGKPIPNIGVFAFGRKDIGGYGLQRAKADANGVFVIKNLAPGTYEVKGEVPKPAPYLLLASKPVRVAVGKTAELPSWRAQKGVVIRGLVRDALTKKPVFGAPMSASYRGKDGDTEQLWGTSDKTGQFTIRVLPGKYRVSISGNIPNYMRPGAAQSIEINAQGKQSGPPIVFDVKPAPVVTGVVLDEAGRPMKAQLMTHELFGRIIDTDAQGRWKYTPEHAGELSFGGGSDDSGYFEVVSPKKVEWPVTKPITITMRHKPWGTATGRVVTPEGEPIEGLNVTGRFDIAIGDRTSIGSSTSATTDKDGRYILTRLGDTSDLTISGKKDGFEFQSGGEVSRQSEKITIANLVFVPLGGQLEGTTTPGAQVVVAGRETRADAKGHFAFGALPAGQNTVFAAKDNLFGSAPATAPLEIKLQPLRPQPQDKALAEQIWAEAVHETKNGDIELLQEWLSPLAFEEAMKAAQAKGDAWQITEAALRWKAGDSLELLRTGLESIKSPDHRAHSFLEAALATQDPALMKRALEEADTALKNPAADNSWREPQLYMVAVLRERLDGAEAGKLAIQRAIAYTLQTHPEKTRTEGIMTKETGRNQQLAQNVEIAAQGSPALLQELLDSIDEGSGFELSALVSALPVLVKTHGFEAAQPLLNQLKNWPAPTLDTERGYFVFDPKAAYGLAVERIIPLIGENSPAKALELARGVQDSDLSDEQRPRVLASAALFQTPEFAAPLYREAVQKIGLTNAARIAALVYDKDPRLGAELFALVRQRVTSTTKNEDLWNNAWIPFAFYYARVNPAQASLILEREWSKSLKAKVETDQLALIAEAMAPIDARRALELARQVPKEGGGWGDSARYRIARFLYADESTRQTFALAQIGSAPTWHPGPVRW